MVKVSDFERLKVFEPKKKGDGTQKLGKVHFVVFSPDGKSVVGFLVKRPDIAGMVKREDTFVALDSFELIDGGILTTNGSAGRDEEARKRLGLEWDKCIEWSGMDARTTDGKELGYVSDASFDARTGEVGAFYVGDGSMARKLVGTLEIPTELLLGYSKGYMVVAPEAAHGALTGGVAAAAGEGYGKAKQGAKELGSKAGDAVNKGAYQMGKAIGSAKRAGEKSEAGKKAAAAVESAKKVDSKTAAKAVGKQLGKTRGMFAAFKDEFDKASK